MSYVYRLAGENLELAGAELKGFLRSQGIEEVPERQEDIAWTESEPSQLRRLALVHEVSRIIERSESLETDYVPEGAFAVRSDLDGVEEELGGELNSEGNRVDLEDPDTVINVYQVDGQYIISEQVLDIDRGLFRGRRNQERPFSSPVSLDPVLARVMVNLSEVSAGEKLLDPFCGTGGILIEAGLCGVDVYGLDLQNEMVEGTEQNLEEYGLIRHDIRQGSFPEIAEIFDNLAFDAAVTDLPYGQSSKSKGEPAERFIRMYDEIVEDGKAVFMYNKPELEGLEADFEIYVHKNLTRYLYILRSGSNSP